MIPSTLFLKNLQCLSGLLTSFAIFLCPIAKAEIIVLGDQELEVTLAQTRQEHTKGLQGVENLPDSKGMLFVFSPARKVCFWMKNTPIDLDIGFFDETERLVKYESMQANMLDLHCSPVAVRYALEVPVGWFDRHKIQLKTVIERSE